MKSSCCGADSAYYGTRANLDIQRDNEELFLCSVCNNICHSIPDDIMSRKQLLENVDVLLNWHKSNKCCAENYFALQSYVLKSVKEHLSK